MALEHLGWSSSDEKLLKVTDEQDLGRRSVAAAVTAAIALTGVN